MNQTLVSINKLSKKGLGNNTMDLQQLTTVPLRMPPPLITEILPDIVNSCRLCLDGDGSNMRNIFCNDHRNWADDDISDQIYESTSLQVTIHDGPTGICRSCLQEVAAVLSFRRRCSRANDYLRNRYQGIYYNSATAVTADQPFFTTFIDLGEENWLMATETDCSQQESLDMADLSDYDMPSPDFGAVDDDALEERPPLTTTCDTEELETINQAHSDSSAPLLLKCRYTLKGPKRNSRNTDPIWPKLTKRDLHITKAYRGLCHLCGKEFQHLWVHLQSHSEVPTETCDMCGKGFRSKANLSLHILTHKDAEMPCEICGKRYRTKMRLQRHKKHHHSGDRPFVCTVCDKKFYTKYNVDVHMRTHTGEKPFFCHICSERFMHSYALKHHTEKSHKKEHAN